MLLGWCVPLRGRRGMALLSWGQGERRVKRKEEGHGSVLDTHQNGRKQRNESPEVFRVCILMHSITAGSVAGIDSSQVKAHAFSSLPRPLLSSLSAVSPLSCEL